MRLKQLKFNTAVAATFSMLVASVLPVTNVAAADPTAPVFTVTPGPTKYSNGDSPVSIATDFRFAGTGNLAESKLTFALQNQNPAEVLSVDEQARIPVTGGSIYAIGSNLFLDENWNGGIKTRSIGTINSVLNGKGKALQLDFSTPLENGDFSQGKDTDVVGWTINGTTLTNGYLVQLGDELATKTQGGNYVSSAVYGDGFKITGPGSTYSYVTDVNYMNKSAGNIYEGKERPLSNLSSASGKIVDGALELKFTGTISGTGYQSPYGTAFGPEAVSSTFTASAGDTLAFDWTAKYESDDYEVYGFLYNVDTNRYTEILYGRGNNRNNPKWYTGQGVVPEDGTYQFRFVAGSYDATGGLALGATLQIDNVRVFSSAITSEVVSAVAMLVQYSYDPYPLPPDQEYRNIDITFTDKDNQTATGSTQVQLYPKLLLTKVEVNNAAPDLAKLTFNLPIGQNSLDLNGFTINGLPVAEVISVQGKEVNVRLAQSVGSGTLDVTYNDQVGNIEYTAKPEIKLGPIQVGSQSGPQVVNTVEPLKLLKVTTHYPDTSKLTLKFNKPVAGESLNLAGFTVGGKPVTLARVNGDEVVVNLGEPYKANESLAYNASAGNVAQNGNSNNKLDTIPGGSLAIISGKLNDLGLYDANNPIPLAPTFHTDISKGYEAVVPNETDLARIDPVALNPIETRTKVAFNGVEVPDGNWNSLPLQEGINTVVASVYTSVTGSVYDVLLEQYSVTLVRATNKLTSLVPSAFGLNPPFQSTTEAYNMNVPFIQSELAWTPTAIDPQAKIEIGVNGGDFVQVPSGAQSPALPLQVGDNDFVVKVTDRLGVVREYKIKAIRAPAKIDDLIVKGGDKSLNLTPSADPEKPNHYGSVVPNATDAVSLDPTSVKAGDTTIKVTLNGGEVAEGDWSKLPLQEGINTIVTSIYKKGDPATLEKQFTITIVRASNKLSSLAPSEGVLSPDFQSSGSEFNMEVSYGTSELTWAPIPFDTAASIEVSFNGGAFVPVASGSDTDRFPLQVGSNTFVFKATDRFGEVREYTVYVTRRAQSSSGGGGAPAPAGSGELGTKNGSTAPFATAKESETGTIAQIDPARLDELLKTKNEKLSVQVDKDSDVSLKGLTADKVKQLTDNGSTLEVGNLLAIYPVPGGQLDLNQIAQQYNNPALADIEVSVGIKRAPQALTESARKAAEAEGYELLVDAVQLDLTFSHNGQTVEPSLLNGYAPKYIALPEGIDPNRITTGVIVNSDGTIFHVPTVVTKINNRYFALINDLRSNGTYSVIWNPQDFDDVRSHWAKDAVNDIAARLDLAGTGNNTFSPDRNVNRSEFAAIVATGMGLMKQNVPASSFLDVSKAAWYHDAVKIASDFGIVLGYEDGLFRGGDDITREQGIAMIGRAYNLVNPQQKPMTQAEIKAAFAPYGDASSISAWAKEVVARMIAAGIVEGESGQLLNPQDSMTRAETAALMRRLLQQTNLID